MFYPIGEKFSFEFSFKLGLIPLLIFYATHIIQLLCWTSVGKLSYILGVQTRYFIPLFALLPLIFSFNKDVRNKDKIDGLITLFLRGFRIIKIHHVKN